MVKEFKLSNVDINFDQVMENLVASDPAAKKRSGQVMDEVSASGESGARFGAAEEAEARQELEDFQPDDGADMDMHQVLAEQMGMEYVELDDYPVKDMKVLRMVPPDLAKQYKVFPLNYNEYENRLTLALCDPSNPTIVDDMRLTLGCDINPVVARENDVLDRINQYYGVGEESIGTLLDQYQQDEEEDVLAGDTSGRVIDLSNVEDISKGSPAVKLANLILVKAIQDRASDIHIEPFENILRIRYRVDGVLREMDSPPKTMHLQLISRLKVNANLNIAETRKPQDGRINLLLPEGREVELRVTCVPTVHGESMVMRVLDKSMMQIGIHQIGMSQEVLDGFLKEIRKANGVVLVTGPTGCGKTTTLYSAINEVKSPEDKLITTEDPVEYQVGGIIQVNINEKVGLTYAKCLRAILRQDPDKILVGEIRDLETAQISIQAALTGHLVFSTLHTNSSAGTVTRLIDMGVEPFLITSTLQAVVGQRLVRTICPNCKREHQVTEEEMLEFNLDDEDIQGMTFYEGAGCEECAFTGYRGRMGIFEYLRMTEEMANLILNRATTDDLQVMARKQGMVTLREDGWMKICMGMTTFAEVAHHTPGDTSEEKERVANESTASIQGDAAPAPQEPSEGQAQTDGVTPDGENAAHLPGLL